MIIGYVIFDAQNVTKINELLGDFRAPWLISKPGRDGHVIFDAQVLDFAYQICVFNPFKISLRFSYSNARFFPIN